MQTKLNLLVFSSLSSENFGVPLPVNWLLTKPVHSLLLSRGGQVLAATDGARSMLESITYQAVK